MPRRGSLPLVRRQSTLRQQQVHDRINEELRIRFPRRILVFCTVLGIWLLSFVVVFVWNIFALFAYSDRPCDQPLKYYLVTVFLFGQTMQPLQRALLQGRSRTAVRTIRCLGALPGILLVCWGLYMISHCKTCQYENPGLYYPTKYFLYQQIALMCLIGIVTVVLGGLGRGIGLSFLPRTSIGCEQAVKTQLSKVFPDAAELIDESDGTVMECPICAESFAGEPGTQTRAVVRTPCNHHFHEECLAHWCRKHLDCPLCRAQVGEPDGPNTRQPNSNPFQRWRQNFWQSRQTTQTPHPSEP